MSKPRTTPPPTLPPPCPHLSSFRSLLSDHGGPKPFFRSLQHCLLPSRPNNNPSPRPNNTTFLKSGPAAAQCISCGSHSLSPRLLACLLCATVHCHSHAVAHADSSPPGHDIAVDVARAELFCCRCCDQVYDRDFDSVVIESLISVPKQQQQETVSVSVSVTRPENLRKRRRVDYRPWTPDLRERVLIGENSRFLESEGTGMGMGMVMVPWGLRGLCNLGNTCFMNSVLQALLHTPPLRNYFLSDRHNRYYCQRNGKTRKNWSSNNHHGGGGGGGGGDDEKLLKKSSCLACDLDAVFSAVFSEGRSPYSPAKFLYSWWQHAANLATYEQQDAHEFFISILDGIHEKAEKDRCKPQSQGNGECCVAHRVFSGILRSDVMCMACGFTSTTYDPCVDISLDLEPNQPEKPCSSKSNHLHSHSDADPTNRFQPCCSSTLTGCLDRFTRPERLGTDQKFFCQQCQVRQESLKQMSIRKLPLVSCFHIKRFEHSSTRNMSKKVDRYLQFPFSLDMAPYLSSSILRSRFGNRIFSFDGDEQDGQEEVSSEFELFAVITHSGKLNAGHYVTYLRLSNQWYKCDDAWITQVNESIVRASQGYMMFYVQKTLYYKASERPGS